MLKFLLKIGIGLGVFLAAMSYVQTGGVSVAGIKQVPPAVLIIFLIAFVATEFVMMRKKKAKT